jgi:dTDP-4-dehydrorhamnose reductase
MDVDVVANIFPRRHSYEMIIRTFFLILVSWVVVSTALQAPHGRGERRSLYRADQVHRREVLQNGVVWGMLVGIAPMKAAAVATGPVAVLGANGKTGMEVVYSLIQAGLTPVSMTRSGINPFERNRKLTDEIKAKIVHYPGSVDVVSEASLREAFAAVKPSAIIFCASSSPSGGLPGQVDNGGVGNTARLAKEIGARLIVISALAVDRPDSQSFQITNTLGGRLNGIMDAKLEGEISVRRTLKDYVIVRPGVLMNGISRHGASDLEINQGDMIGGGLSRDELAAVAVAALQSGKQGITVEAYRTNTRQKLQKEFNEFSGREQHGDTYVDLFQSVEVD